MFTKLEVIIETLDQRIKVVKDAVAALLDTVEKVLEQAALVRRKAEGGNGESADRSADQVADQSADQVADQAADQAGAQDIIADEYYAQGDTQAEAKVQDRGSGVKTQKKQTESESGPAQSQN